MTYSETLAWMFAQLPMFQRKGQSAFKKDLTNTKKLVNHLKNPHQGLKYIHVAGTNGKGSVCHILSSILQEAGYKTGLHTSPHLKDFRERIKINGKYIPKNYVVDFIEKHRPFFEKEHLSFFEMTVGLTFQYFKDKQVDIAVIETGLGGRLDSTNIIQPEISIITNIGLDHTAILGNTLEQIAKEKAGIIKSYTPIIIGERQQKTTAVFLEKAKAENAELIFADQLHKIEYKHQLIGDYQEKNIKTTLTGINKLQTLGWKINSKHIVDGLKKVKENTTMLGRWQELSRSPKIVCDAAHNKEGLTYVVRQIKNTSYNSLHFVIGVVQDKDLSSILPLLPKNAVYYFCKPNVPRGLNAKKLQSEAVRHHLKGKTYSSVKQALQTAKKNAKKNDFIFIGGSNFTIAEII